MKKKLTNLSVRNLIIEKTITKKLFVICVILLLSFSSYSQTNFMGEYESEKVYYDSLVQVLGPDSMDGTGYKQFYRRYNYWRPKLSSTYDYDDYQNDLIEYVRSYSPPQHTLNKWHLIGPNNIPVGGSSRGTGQIHYIFSSSNNSGYYSCSPVGGLFRLNSSIDYWSNLTDTNLPRSGVSSICRTNVVEQAIYITTGNGEGYRNKKIWQSSIGVYKSTDGGTSWQNLGLAYDPFTDIPILHMRKVICVEKAVENPHIIVTTTEGLFETQDVNSTEPEWNKLIPGEFYDVIPDLKDTAIIYAAGSNKTGIYKYNLVSSVSTKIFDIDTLTYPFEDIEFPEQRRISLNMSPAADSLLFAVVALRDNSYSTLLRYNLNTGKWHRLEIDKNFNGYERKMGWTIRPQLNDSNQLQIIGRNVNPLMLITNGLSNDTIANIRKVWSSDINPHADLHYLLIEDNDSVIWAGTDGGIYKGYFVNDTLIDWNYLSNGLGVSTVNYVDADYSGKFVTSGQFDCGSNTYNSEDEFHWVPFNKFGGDGYQNIVSDENDFYLSAFDGQVHNFYQNTDISMYMGSHTTIKPDCSQDTTETPNANFDTYYVKVGDNFYAAGTKEVMKYDNGVWSNWSNFNSQIGCAKSGTWKVAAKDVNGVHQIYTSTYQYPDTIQYIFKSINGGGPSVNKWVKIKNTPSTGWISSLQISSNNPDSLLLAIQKKIYAVNSSNPNSPNWYDLTYNLNAGNINSITYNGGKTWIAAEYGVYYLVDGSQEWIDYSDNLPNCEIRDIKVKNKRVYVATYGRGVWLASSPSCGNIAVNDTISNGETVGPNLTKRFYGDVIIPSGNTYTIYGTVEMATDCRIIVERGAKLIIDGGKITKACPDFWPGIELRGNSNAIQDTINQGWVIIKNNGTIEYAKTGIETIKYDSAGRQDVSFTGGVIQAENAIFRNNITSVSMYAYPKSYALFPILNNKSYFKFSTFEWDTAFYDFGESPKEHLQLVEVRGVELTGNLLTNKLSRNYPYPVSQNKFGIGIAVYNAGFFANGDGIDPESSNIFRNLEYGIKTFAYFGTNKPIEIQYNLFEYNQTGCYISAESYLAINKNIFVIRSGENNISSDGYSGLYLDACTGYQVEQNEFISNYSPNWSQSAPRCYGLVVNNSGPEDNMIYNNKFFNLGYATIAQNQNKDKKRLTGLQYKCNLFQDNFSDISVTWSEQEENNGIAEHQGSAANDTTAPAGNLFSQLGKYNYSDINNSGNYFYYHLPHPALSLSYPISPIYYSSSTVQLNFNTNNTYWTPTKGCPSNFKEKTKTEIETAINSSTEMALLYSDTLQLKIDNGNTTSLNLGVTTSTIDETSEIRTQLLDASPYLSDTVMVSAVTKEEVLPNSIITEILSSNPHSSKSTKIIEGLNNRDNPPSENEMSLIMSNDTIIGNKELLESKYSYYSSQKQQNVNELIRFMLKDSTNNNIIDSIVYQMQKISTPYSYYLQAMANFDKMDSIGVVNKLNMVTSDFDLDDRENEVLAGFEEYFDFLLEMQSNGTNIENIDSLGIARLYNIMENHTNLPQAYARNILIKTTGFKYNEPYILPDTTSTEKSSYRKYSNNSGQEKNKNYLTLYPNPANSFITVEYKTPLKMNGSIEITTIDGIFVNSYQVNDIWGEKVIDLRDFVGGVYIVKLLSNGNLIQSEKFIKIY